MILEIEVSFWTEKHKVYIKIFILIFAHDYYPKKYPVVDTK
jgi:hypothetical protein